MGLASVRRVGALLLAVAVGCWSCSSEDEDGMVRRDRPTRGREGQGGKVQFADNYQRIRIEAEDAVQIVSDDALPEVGGKVMRVVEDPTASGGKCIWIPDKAGKPNPDPDEGKPPRFARAVYKFKVTVPGEYTFWCRRNWFDQCGDTLAVRFDKEGAPHMDAFLFGSDGKEFKVWKWSPVYRAGDPRRFFLGAGEHTMEILNLEDGPRFDVILLTDDPGYVPQGMEK